MTSPDSRSPSGSRQDDPRQRDLDNAREEVISRLHEREIELNGNEDSETLVELLEVVERFETAVTAAGGDNMNNSPDSDDPERAEFVLPMRRADESTRAYIRRIESAIPE
jgi:hypothetical protein